MFRKNVAGQFIHVQGVDTATGGIKSGVTWTVRRCIDGTFAAATGTATEDGTTGWYKFAMSQADTNGNNIGFGFTGTGAVPQTVNIVTTACDPTSTAFGLSIAKTTNITGFNDIAATDIVSSGAITTSGGAVSTVTAVSGSVGSVTGAVGSVTGNVGGNVDGSVGSVTGLTAANLDVAVSTRLATAGYTAPLDAAGTRTAVGLAAASLDTQLSDLPTATENADALLNRDFAAVSDTNARTLLNAARFLRNKFSTTAGTLTVTKEDDATPAWTSTLTSDPLAEPITGSDPA